MSIRRRRFHAISGLLLAWGLVVGCGEGAPALEDDPLFRSRVEGSPNARPDIVATLREDLAFERHAADGGGHARLDREASTAAVVGRPGRWEIVYEAGPAGIADGGYLFLQVSPFWGWSEPQTRLPERPGFTTVHTDADGVELTPEALGQHLLAIRLSGRQLREGESVRIAYEGFPDRFAGRGSRFWIAVDGDGDGIRKVLEDSPTVDVEAGPAAGLQLILPTTARPGGTARLTVAVLDALGNAGGPFEGTIVLEDEPGGAELPRRVELEASDRGHRTIEFVAPEEGTYRLRANGPGGLTAESNPMIVSAEAPRVLWGDLQIHSGISDGTGTPEDIYAYARDVAALDVAALTDHDHWGVLALDAHDGIWAEIEQLANRFHEPGRFVTLVGYEWTSWIYGHRHVLFPGKEGRVFSSIDEAQETPQQLWDALREWNALTIAHHTAGEPVATDWTIPPDPELETVVEIVSVHGSSEAADSPRTVRGAISGHFVRDALDRGYRLGFVGSGDSHDGHPGLSWISSGVGGLAGLLSEDLTREGVLDAIRNRRTYATSGPRIYLHATLDGRPMGSDLPAGDGTSRLEVEVVAPAALERIDLVRGGAVVERIDCGLRRECLAEAPVAGLGAGEYLYLRVVQADGGMAWTSPFFGSR